MVDSNNTEPGITFVEFEKATAEEGHPLYKGIKTNDLSNFKELLFHVIMTHTKDANINNVRLLKEQWHEYYAEALMAYLFSPKK